MFYDNDRTKDLKAVKHDLFITVNKKIYVNSTEENYLSKRAYSGRRFSYGRLVFRTIVVTNSDC